MIPDFDVNGKLPPGIHLATLDELKTRFAYNIIRRQLFNGLEKLIYDLKNKIGCKIIFVDGSFVTNKAAPNDIDVCWDNRGVDLNNAFISMPILWDMNHPRVNQQTAYSCDIFPAFSVEQGSGTLFIDFFQIDKLTNTPKGIIQINI